jgi:3-oxoacyl-(acyl-carrier-protein) synthase
LRVEEKSKKSVRHKTIATIDLYTADSTLLARLEGCEVVSSETLSYVETNNDDKTKEEDPIVVVGMGVHYPGAPSVDTFWSTLLNGEIHTKPIAKEDLHREDKVSKRTYGKLNTNEEEEEILLRVSKDALKDVSEFNPETCGIVSASLNFPRNDVKREMKKFNDQNTDEEKTIKRKAQDAATYVAKHLKLGKERYCFDAACASGLYALKLASDALHHGDADTMLCAACTKPESYFVLHGFSTFRALAAEGSSSAPLQSKTNGMVPGEGCAVRNQC